MRGVVFWIPGDSEIHYSRATASKDGLFTNTVVRHTSRRGDAVKKLLAAVLAALIALTGTPVLAAPPPDFRTDLIVGAGLDSPSGFEIAPDGRTFVLERAGTVKIVKDGSLLPEPFAVLDAEPSGDRGLIGVTFDPGFGVANHYVYFYYTGRDLHNRVVRYDASGDVAADGPVTIFRTETLSQQLHVGGSLAFGPDGMLYLAVGDNGYPPNAQLLTNPHGKILRLTRDGSIPADNPFAGQSGREQAIWAWGFRNPWRFQFDPATGELYGGDVGDYTSEEVNRIVRGGNYGWPLKEGHCSAQCEGYEEPLHVYAHDGASAAVTGGPVYRGSQFPQEYRGSLFFGDYAKGFIRRLDLRTNSVEPFDEQAGSVVDLKEGPDGSLYYLTYLPGRLYRVGYELGNHAPRAVATSDVVKGIEPLTVRFDAAGSSDPEGGPLTYRWQFGDGTSSSENAPVKTYGKKGVYVVALTVTDAEGNSSQAAPLVIQAGLAPTVTVAVPSEGARYRAGDTITYNAFASDAAGFDLDDNDIRTTVVLHHGTHIHPFAGPLTGRAGTFTIPVTGESSADTWYEITVKATDKNGLSTGKSVNIRPVTSTFTVTSSPPGLTVQLDGIPGTTPHTVDGVVGFRRELYAPPVATAADGTTYDFEGWSDGGAIRHTITTPAEATTYTAIYRPAAPFTGTYFNTGNLAGPPVLTRQDAAVDFAWGDGSPDPTINTDDFSVRWQRAPYFAEGRYRFTAAADDGLRLYVDRKLVLDRWNAPPGAAEWTGDLGAGRHAITVEYHEEAGTAFAKLDWQAALDQPDASWSASYWNTPGTGTAPTIPAGPPALTRAEPRIDHDWAGGSPGDGVDADHFAARWTRTLSLAPGEYEFTATADDGARLFVDGVRVINRWSDGRQPDTATVTVDGGPHTIVLDYYENAGDALAGLAWRQVGDPVEPPGWTGEYWNGMSLEGPPDLVRDDGELAFDWGGGSPGPGIGDDRFSARWTRTESLPAGLYRFGGVSDDGVRVFLDGVPIVDRWRDQNAPFSAERMVLAGSHELRVEYYENEVGAELRFGYERIGSYGSDDGWRGEYFDNHELSGVPALTRTEPELDFDWGEGSPGPEIRTDAFSARWTRTSAFRAGTHRFTATADDGIRVLVDGVTVLSGWYDHGPTTFTADVPLAEGDHTVVVEYYENSVGASARLAVTPPP
jgi:glucose/arabinose dehydrogenase/PKD repeat protein